MGLREVCLFIGWENERIPNYTVSGKTISLTRKESSRVPLVSLYFQKDSFFTSQFDDCISENVWDKMIFYLRFPLVYSHARSL